MKADVSNTGSPVTGSPVTGSTVTVTDEAIVIMIARPETSGRDRDGRAAMLAFAARADSYEGLVLWHRYEAVHRLLQVRLDEAAALPDADVFTRLYDPLAQTAASFAVAAGLRQGTAENFVDRAVACLERIPAIGRLMRSGVITASWFHRAIELTALVDDADLLALIDAEAAHRLSTIGDLTRSRLESTISAVVAGVCENDPRTRPQLRSDAAVAAMARRPFGCGCGEQSCAATLSDHDVAERCARIVLHVVVRKETLAGASTTPAFLAGVGPLAAPRVREIATRPDTVVREVAVDSLLGASAQSADPYRPTAACDTLVRGLFGECTTGGCTASAWHCDLDHVQEFDHADPAAGGPTCWCNLNPKCRFHHGVKTHVSGWLDDQIVDANGVVWTETTTPEGLVVRAQALNSWLLPELGLLSCGHPAASATRPGSCGSSVITEPARRPRSRTEAKHRYRMQQRAAPGRVARATCPNRSPRRSPSG
ncbi:DUF222 domain-containing protein [Gordonia aichiensis]|uniref:DUF222 domain-containing protein n=1 Tax=Gordonia aichiensis TaxID=36820 RepID=UPI003267CC8B